MEEKWYIKKIKGENFIYHCFTFDPIIQEHTFIGNEFIGMDQADEVDVINTFERIVDAGPDGFIPQLIEELKNIFGEGNYVYDGYEIGENETSIVEFNLYFYIKESLYESLLKKVEQWSKYHGIKDLISWENKLLSGE